MENAKIDMYLMTNAKYFSSEEIPFLKNDLEKVEDAKFFHVSSVALKDPTIMLIVSLLGGNLGIDRFMLGQTGLGIAKLLTCGGLGIWSIVDWFIVGNATRDYNLQKVRRAMELSTL
jgi:TM2 domain-containing membrane protein YozV